MYKKNTTAIRQALPLARNGLFLFLACLFIPSLAFAGGLEPGTTALSDVSTWAYGALGIVAGLYLMYLIVMAWTKHGTWMQVLIGCAEVAAAGGVLVLLKYLWSIFGSGS